MKTIAATALGALLVAATANAQPAPAPVDANAGPVCIQPYRIDHTNTVDPSTVLFYMKDGKIWKNTLQGPCPGLLFNGFAYVVHGDEVCSNMQGIRVLRTGEVCMLGAFTPYIAPPKPHAP